MQRWLKQFYDKKEMLLIELILWVDVRPLLESGSKKDIDTLQAGG
jgi:hypothetical protein